jgi:hypothetical protein
MPMAKTVLRHHNQNTSEKGKGRVQIGFGGGESSFIEMSFGFTEDFDERNIHHHTRRQPQSGSLRTVRSKLDQGRKEDEGCAQAKVRAKVTPTWSLSSSTFVMI